MFDVLIALVLFGLGYCLGRRRPAVPAAAAEGEPEQLREDRAAFRQLMGYNAQRAYGLDEEP